MCSEEICFCFDIVCSMFTRDSVEVYEKVGIVKLMYLAFDFIACCHLESTKTDIVS
jgi:hypothetical protein